MKRDFLLYPNIYISPSIFFASQRRVGTRSKLLANAYLLSIALEEFRSFLYFYKDVTIKLDNIRAKNWFGFYDDYTRSVTLRYDKNFRSMLITLAHELVHAEQFRSVRLYFMFNNNKFVPYWKGKKYLAKSSSYYYNSPWEDEARERQFDLSTIVYANLFNHVDKMNNHMKEAL